ncbi:hypothetical protein BCR33DRAFT_782616 [Rhizoclosmatium globosum]|uniref:Ketopantoate reductase C-terminal domain-containing protein n=1 Tax=Rhizoclosmatium globosum TaxID=329046 RepID=A0A1Y2CML1_9FUNG|nr:hypothetical protein BCR33DRAFT_782616 [Rhizoclosmatium globosum]|eukprot:ORY48243.1 hypothetical protein BCR33DRAFT_782616 [Rhizoclosmatium globosum]
MDLFSVNHVGSGVSLFGPAIEQNDLPSNTVYSKLLSAEDLNVTAPLPSKELEAKLLLKLAINSSLNPLTAIFNSPNGDISASMEGRRLLEELCEEIALLPEFKEGLGMSSSELGSAVTTVANATARNRNSMDATQSFIVYVCRSTSLL